MRGMTLEAIAVACDGRYVGPADKKTEVITGVDVDSRKIEKGYMFVAVKGERVDGHKFISQVFEKGAAVCLVEELPAEPAGPCIVVPSTLEAIKAIAEYYRSTLTIPVIGIAGSVGKTSTKEMVAAVLGAKFNVLKTMGNYNNEIGVPLTLFRIRDEHEVAVIEMGISDFGEMHRLSKMVRPNFVVMTNIGQCHLENLKTRDGILKAKSEIFDFAASGCVACLNGDDDKLRLLKDKEGIQPVYFGMGEGNTLTAKNVQNLGLEGVRCTICTPEGEFEAETSIPGNHMAYNALAGTAVGLALGLTVSEITKGIRALKPTGGRNNIVKTDKYTVIDDCYNANPVSMKASIDVLTHASGRTVALLGDMGELGENEKKLHAEVGAYAAMKGIDLIVCIGELSAFMAEAAAEKIDENQRVFHLASREELLEKLPSMLEEGDSILVKASHFMKFEEVVKSIVG